MTNAIPDRENPAKAARSWEEIFPLIDYCRAGRLKEVGEWIAAGHPIDPPATAKRSRRRSPIQVAIEKEFYALAEMLLEGGSAPTADVLEYAVQHREAGVAKLLLDRGVSANSIWLSAVFDAGPDIIKLFIEHGFDPTADLGYYNALLGEVHPLLFILKEFKARFPDVQRQANMALCYHCDKGNLRAVSLLLWAGANADARVPHPGYEDEPEMWTTPLKEAAGAGHLEVLKRLKPQDYPEALGTIMDAVWLHASPPIIDYLLSLGAPLNTKSNGGSVLLENLLGTLDIAARQFFGPPKPGEMEAKLDLIQHVVSRGAKWMPDLDHGLRHHRDRLRHLECGHVVQLFKILKEGGATTVEFLEGLLASPSFKKRLGDQLYKIEAVLHPPPPKPEPTPTTTRARIEPRPRPPMADLCSQAGEALLDLVRQEPRLHFSERNVRTAIYAFTVRRRLGLGKGDKENLSPIFAKAVQKLNTRLTSFSLVVGDDEWRSGSKYFEVHLTGDSEWTDAVREAWSGAEPNPFYLSDAGLRLLELVRLGQIDPGITKEGALASGIGLSSREENFDHYLMEVRSKAGVGLRWEAGERTYGESRTFRIWLEAGQAPIGDDVPALNPVLQADFTRANKSDYNATRIAVQELIIKANPKGAEPLYLFHIRSHRELRRCFPGDNVSGDTLAKFFDAVAIHRSVKRYYNFSKNAECWSVTLAPENSWTESVEALRHELARPSLEERFGVSLEAAKLISWIETIPSDHMKGCYTPIVEAARERWIGIASPWGDANFPAYLQMLMDEINQKTEYDLKIQPWTRYSSSASRIRVGRKSSDLNDVLITLHWMAARQDVSLNVDQARSLIEDLVAGRLHELVRNGATMSVGHHSFTDPRPTASQERESKKAKSDL